MRRLAWVAVGFGLGAAATHKATRGGRAPVLATTAGTAAAHVRRRIDAAVSEGRVEMREREARLREVFAVAAPPDARTGEPGKGDEIQRGPRFRGREAGDRR